RTDSASDAWAISDIDGRPRLPQAIAYFARPLRAAGSQDAAMTIHDMPEGHVRLDLHARRSCSDFWARELHRLPVGRTGLDAFQIGDDVRIRCEIVVEEVAHGRKSERHHDIGCREFGADEIRAFRELGVD